MARIKFVLNERRLALIDAQRRAREQQSAEPQEDDGNLFETSQAASN